MNFDVLDFFTEAVLKYSLKCAVGDGWDMANYCELGGVCFCPKDG